MRERGLEDLMPASIKARCSRTTEWRAPWRPDGRRPFAPQTRWPGWIRELRGRAGVYFIRCARERQVLYIGRGTCVKKALIRHFSAWGEDPRGLHRRVTFDRAGVEVKIYLLRCASWLAATEADLIAVHRPRENSRLESSSCTIGLEEVPF